MDYILTIPVAFLCVVIVFFVQYYAFGTSFRQRDNSRVTSFFPLSGVIDARVYRSLATLSALPLSFLYAFFVLQSFGLSRSTIKFISELTNLELLDLLLQPLPTFLYMPIALLVLIYLFRGILNYLRQFIERVILFLSGLSDYAETRLQFVSECLINEISYNDAVDIIREKQHQDMQHLPLPEELYTASCHKKLAYHLLQLSTKRINEAGFSPAILSEVKEIFFCKISSKSQNEITDILDTGHIPNLLRRFFIGFAMYFAVAAFWAAITPMLNETIDREFGITWPIFSVDGKWWPFLNHIKSIIAATCISIVPAIAGIRMLQMREKTTGRRDGGATVGIIIGVVLASSVLNLLYLESVLNLDLVSGYLTERRSTEGDTTILISYWVYWLFYSLIAGGVVIMVTLVGGGAARGVLAGAIVMGAGYFVAHLFFEIALSLEGKFSREEYYWHQGGLGMVLGVTGLAISAYIFRTKTKSMATAAANPRDAEVA